MSPGRTRDQMAEWEGLPRISRNDNRIKGVCLTRARYVYQSCVPKSTDFDSHPPKIGSEVARNW
jgi:hypothetical protein